MHASSRWWRGLALAALLLPLLSTAAAAPPTPEPATILNSWPVDSMYTEPTDFTPISDTAMLFSALTETQGRELWVTDGTPGGTVAMDLAPGAVGSAPHDFQVLDNEAWFWASSAADLSAQLWRSDGTAAGTQVLDVAYAHVDTIASGPLAKLNQRLFFAGAAAAGGSELWASNGTTSGTYQVRDINPGPGGSDPAVLTPAGTWLYFTAFNGTTWEVWRTDREPAHTTLVLPDVRASEMAVLDGYVYVAGEQADGACGLWQITNAPQPTATLVAPVCAHDLTGIAGHLVYWTWANRMYQIFAATPATAPTRLFEQDLPPAQILPGNAHFGLNTLFMLFPGGVVKWIKFNPAGIDIQDIPAYSLNYAGDMVLLDDVLLWSGFYFIDVGGLGSVFQLFDGTDFDMRTTDNAVELVPWQDRLFYNTCPFFAGDELGRATDDYGCASLAWNTPAEIVALQPLTPHYILTPFAPQPNGPLALAGAAALDNGNVVSIVPDANPDDDDDLIGLLADGSVTPALCADCADQLIPVGANALVLQNRALTGLSDGATYTPLPDAVRQRTPTVLPYGATAYLLLTVPGMPGYRDLWQTDGTLAGTVDLQIRVEGDFGEIRADQLVISRGFYARLTVVDLPDLTVHEYPINLPAGEAVQDYWLLDDAVLMVTRDATNYSLWRFDGSANPPELILSSIFLSNPIRMIAPMGATLAFLVDSNAIWLVGSTGAASPLDELNIDMHDSVDLVRGGPDRAFIIYENRNDHYINRVWLLTPAGLTLFYTGDHVANPWVNGDWLYFQTYSLPATTNEPHKLWRSDGTPGTTTVLFTAPAQATLTVLARDASVILVKVVLADGSEQLWRVPAAGGPAEELLRGRSLSLLAFWPDRAALTVNTEAGRELWLSDLTAAGTQRQGALLVSDWRQVDDRLFMAADDGVYGRESWVTDGTPAGTHLLADINRGPADGVNPSGRFLPHSGYSTRKTEWVANAGRVWFNGFDSAHGEQVFSVALQAAPQVQAPPAQTTGGTSVGIPITLAASPYAELVSGPFTLTLTLPAGASYASDTSGVAPALNGSTVIWEFASLPDAFVVQLDLPEDAAPPAEYTLAWTLDSAAGSTSASTLIQVRFQIFAPLLRR